MSTILQSNASYKLELKGTTGSKKVMTDENQNETGVVGFNKNKPSKTSLIYSKVSKCEKLKYYPRARAAQWVMSLNPTTRTSLSPIRRGFAPGFVNYKKGVLDSQSQVIKFTSCFSPGTPAFSTTKTGHHDIAEILLKVALKHQKSNQIKYYPVVPN